MKTIESGHEFTARKSFPFTERGRTTKDEENVVDIKTGERGQVLSYNKEKKEYVVLNLSLDIEHAWFTISEEDLFKLKRLGTTK